MVVISLCRYDDPNASAAEPARKVARVAKRKRMQLESGFSNEANSGEENSFSTIL